jgi:hypothetical protein
MYGLATYDFLTKSQERVGMSSLFFMQDTSKLFVDGVHKQKELFPNLKARFVFDYYRCQRRGELKVATQLA